MKYMLLIYADENAWTEPERQACYGESTQLCHELQSRGKFYGASPLQPVATALFANSPFSEAKPSGFLSSRARVWTDTDPDRTGMPDFMFGEDFGFERYVDWLLDVPMYFVHRGTVEFDFGGDVMAIAALIVGGSIVLMLALDRLIGLDRLFSARS